MKNRSFHYRSIPLHRLHPLPPPYRQRTPGSKTYSVWWYVVVVDKEQLSVLLICAFLCTLSIMQNGWLSIYLVLVGEREGLSGSVCLYSPHPYAIYQQVVSGYLGLIINGIFRIFKL